MENLLEINNLSYSYKDKTIFNNLQFSIKPATINIILGTNSSGKTTLIRLLSGILQTNDFINVNGISLNKNNYKEYLLSIGVVFYEDSNKFLFEKVIDELAFPLENLNYKRKDINNRVEEVTKILEIQNCINKNISDLTTFEQVKVLIATSIMHNPKIIFLDDILCALNNNEVTKIFKIFNKLKESITIFITSSCLNNILFFDNVIVLNNGKCVISDIPENVLKSDNELSKIGFIIPPMIDLSLKLNFYDLVDEIITDVDRMVDTLWK